MTPPSGVAPMTTPPRMCAVNGMFSAASVSQLCGIASCCSARWRTNSLSSGTNVGLGLSGSWRVCRRTPFPSRFRRGSNCIAPSCVCIAPTIHERRDHPDGLAERAKSRGRRATAAASFSGRVRRVPSPVSGTNHGAIASAIPPYVKPSRWVLGSVQTLPDSETPSVKSASLSRCVNAQTASAFVRTPWPSRSLIAGSEPRSRQLASSRLVPIAPAAKTTPRARRVRRS